MVRGKKLEIGRSNKIAGVLGNVNAVDLILVQTTKRRTMLELKLDSFGRVTPATPNKPGRNGEQEEPEKEHRAVLGEAENYREKSVGDVAIAIDGGIVDLGGDGGGWGIELGFVFLGEFQV